MNGLLNRRYLRVKALQYVYAYNQDESPEIARFEKELIRSIDKASDLYLAMLDLFLLIRKEALEEMETRKTKRLPTPEDLNPNMRFVNNGLLVLMDDNFQFRRALEQRKINWRQDEELPKRLWREIRESTQYQNYMTAELTNFQTDKEFLLAVFKRFIAENEQLHDAIEEDSIFWMEDLPVVAFGVVKTLNMMRASLQPSQFFTFKLYKNEKEDLAFMKKLFRQTLARQGEYEKLIAEKAKNWEQERLAELDVTLMKMAITEFTDLETVPPKVTINEYLEISKNYSTPKSWMFINGILDKLLIELKAAGRVVKQGRGLVE